MQHASRYEFLTFIAVVSVTGVPVVNGRGRSKPAVQSKGAAAHARLRESSKELHALGLVQQGRTESECSLCFRYFHRRSTIRHHMDKATYCIPHRERS